MTRREMLVERYEDALFALLMNEVAEAEGRKALEENQRLCDSGEMVIPEEVHRRCLRTIARKQPRRMCGDLAVRFPRRRPRWPS